LTVDGPAHNHSPAPAVPHHEVAGLADHLFRHEAAKLVSVLTGIFGIDRLQLAEDVVQEALVRALKTWPFYGVPANPAAWLTQTAKNIALDAIRREKSFQEKQERIVSTVEQWAEKSDTAGFGEGELGDERLRLMFACCHPALPAEAQTALALKTLCAFSPGEIAKAFLTTEAAVLKRLTRARQRLRDMRVPFEIPAAEEMPARLDGVLQTLYLLFNEGYKASSGDRLIREELCQEAIRLATLLAAHPATRQPRVHALAALMLLSAARLPARVDEHGNIHRLEEQDRSKWDKPLIGQGMLHLGHSAAGGEVSEYHLQAGIAALHCAAPDYRSTDWPRILGLYDRLIAIDNSPVVALNRAVALASVHGPEEGIKALEKIRSAQLLESYHLLYAVMAEFEYQLNDFESAAAHLREALSRAELQSERDLLAKRLQACQAAR
jgi:RNA polymerase sigma-70 factor (ECF subfamily)